MLGHSLGVAQISRLLADSSSGCPLRGEEAFVAGLLHDVGKAWEFDPERRKRWSSEQKRYGRPSIRHPAMGAHICLTVGLPEEIAHIAMAHSGEGELLVRSLECMIVHQADYTFWNTLLAGGHDTTNDLAQIDLYSLDAEAPIFVDDFESGTTAAWSSVSVTSTPARHCFLPASIPRAQQPGFRAKDVKNSRSLSRMFSQKQSVKVVRRCGTSYVKRDSRVISPSDSMSTEREGKPVRSAANPSSAG